MRKFRAAESLFTAHHIDTVYCDCGCNGYKLFALDANDMVHAEISFTPEQWITIVLPHIQEECLKIIRKGGH